MEERFVIMYLCHQFPRSVPGFDEGEDDSVAPGLRDLVSLIVVQQGLCISLLSFAGYALTAPWHFGSLQTLSDFSHFFCVSQWPQQVHSFSPTGEKVREC